MKGAISSYEVVLSLQLYAVMLDTSFPQFPPRKILKLPGRLLPFLISTDESQFLSACDVLHSLFQSLQLYPNQDLITSLCDKFMDLFEPFLSQFIPDLPPSSQPSQYLRIQLNDPESRDCVARGCFRTLNLLIEFFKESMRKRSKQLVRLVMCCVSYREPTVQNDVLCSCLARRLLSRPACAYHSHRQRAVLHAVGSPILDDVQNAGAGVAHLSEVHVALCAYFIRDFGAKLSGAEFWLCERRDSAARRPASRRIAE